MPSGLQLQNAVVIVALTVTTAALPASARHHKQRPQPTQAQYQQEPDLPNFYEVHPWLYRGAQPGDRGYKELYDMGVRTVINLRQTKEKVETEKGICSKLGMRYIDMPMNPLVAPPEKYVRQFLDIVQRAKEHSDQGSVFVHCAGGQDRTGCMIGIYRVMVDKNDFDTAKSEMLRHGFHEQFREMEQCVRQHTPGNDPQPQQ